MPWQFSTAHLAVVIVPASIIILNFMIRRLIQSRLPGRGRNTLPLPPGPRQIPLLGNAHTMNIDEPWKTYADWHAKYVNVVYFRLLDQDVIVLGSQQIAVELLEKRSRLYSDRPFIASIPPFGGDRNFTVAPYGDHWRLCRRIFHQTFRSKAAINLRPMQLHRARQLVKNVAENPDQYRSHYSTFSIAVALSAAYDYEPSRLHDPIVQVIEEFTSTLTQVVSPEKSVLIKLFPFLLHVPDWLPGSSLKRQANHCYGLSIKAMEMPYRYAEEKTKASHEYPTLSMVSDHLSRIQEKDELYRAKYISALKEAAVSSILASEETTGSTLMVFTLAMVLHAHVWKRAQAEIDAVVGTNRLPDFGDRPALPYVDVIIRETLRWQPVTPFGMWHVTLGSDIYNGYYIPKGATVIANAWAMSRDETRFPNPEAFIPERFLDEEGLLNDNNPADFVFGFGRRMCPGRYTADASLWSSIVTMLAAFDFCLAKDTEGKEVVFEPKWLNGGMHRPDVFPCQISLRTHVNKQCLDTFIN